MLKLRFYILVSALLLPIFIISQNAPVFLNSGGTEQLCFNNACISTMNPVFRLSQAGNTYNQVRIEINTKSDFTGTSVLQTYTATYTAGSPYNFTFTTALNLIENTLYSVRASVYSTTRKKWGSWSAEVYTFTYKSTGTTEWYQSFQNQLAQSTLSNLTATASGDIQFKDFNGNTNPFTDPSFETGSGWSTYSCCSGGQIADLNTDAAFISNGSKSLRLYNNDPGSWGYLVNEYVFAAQQVDLTGITSLNFDLFFWLFAWNNMDCTTNLPTEFRIIIGGTEKDITGDIVYTHQGQTPCMQYWSYLNQSATINYTGTYWVKFVNYTKTQYIEMNSAQEQYRFYVDNISISSTPPTSGTAASASAYISSFFNASTWNKLRWTQTLNGGSITLKIQKFSANTWSDITGLDNISFSTDGAQEYDISAATTESQIRIFATFSNTGGSPVLSDWTLNTIISCSPPALTPNVNTSNICKGTNIILNANPAGGSACTGNWEYSWTDGTMFWSGQAFDSQNETYNQSYSIININNIAATNTYTAKVRCSDNASCNSSAALKVDVLEEPSITTDPLSQEKCSGEAVVFTVESIGSAPFSYIWIKNNLIIDGATTSNFIINKATIADTGKYNCEITNICGSRTTNTAILKINSPPLFKINLQNQNSCEGDSIIFTANAISDLTFNYQWLKNNNNVDGATTSILKLSNISKSDDEAEYLCKATNSCGEASTKATLTIYTKPDASVSLLIQSKCRGESTSYTLSAKGIAPIYYQWKKDNINIDGATKDTLNIAELDVINSGHYSCEIKNVCGSTFSDVADLIVNPLPQLNLGKDTTITLSDTILIKPGSNYTTYLWNDGSKNNSLQIIGANAGAGLHKYLLTVSDDNGCSASDSIKITVTNEFKYFSVSGIVIYNNPIQTTLDNVMVYLKDEQGNPIDTTITDDIGFYTFNKLQNGNYQITATKTTAWGGSNPLDALFVNRYFIGLYNFNDGLCEQAADVNLDYSINPLDALYINRRFIGMIDKFTTPDWIFETISLTIDKSDQTLNIKGICTGDVNASYPSK